MGGNGPHISLWQGYKSICGCIDKLHTHAHTHTRWQTHSNMCTGPIAKWTKWFQSWVAITQLIRFTCNKQQSTGSFTPLHSLTTPPSAFSSLSLTYTQTHMPCVRQYVNAGTPPFPPSPSRYTFSLSLSLIFCYSSSTSFAPSLRHLVTLLRNKPICRIDLEPWCDG